MPISRVMGFSPVSTYEALVPPMTDAELLKALDG